VIRITPNPVTKEIFMKIKLLLIALALSMSPALVSAEGAPAVPEVVCHVDQAPQMLVPEYLCQQYGGEQYD
jgi:hypothetical protein